MERAQTLKHSRLMHFVLRVMARSEIFLRGRVDVLIFTALTPQLHVTGEITRPVWERLARRGFTALLNVRAEDDDRAAGIDAPNYLQLKVVDYQPPTVEQLAQGVAFIREHISHGEKVLVHCGAGMGRSVTVVAAYLVSTGITPTRAFEWIAKARPFIEPTEAQVEAVNQFAAQMSLRAFPEGLWPVPVLVAVTAN